MLFYRKSVFYYCTIKKKVVPLRQLYNKEKQLKLYLTINLTIMAYVISEDCIACGTCIDECPMGAISEGDIYTIDADLCTECGTCADVCPSEAISKG